MRENGNQKRDCEALLACHVLFHPIRMLRDIGLRRVASMRGSKAGQCCHSRAESYCRKHCKEQWLLNRTLGFSEEV